MRCAIETEAKMTVHADRRMRQRGIRAVIHDLVFDHGIDFPAGRGCSRRILTDKLCRELAMDGYSVAEMEKARTLVLVVSAGQSVVTAIKPDKKKLPPQGWSHRRSAWTRLSNRRRRTATLR